MARCAGLVAGGLVLAGVAGGCGGTSRVATPCGPSLGSGGLFVAGLGSRPTVAHPLSCAKRITLAHAIASVGVPLPMPRTTLMRPADVGPVWSSVSQRAGRKIGTIAATFPAQGVIVEYTWPAPSAGTASHFRAMAAGIVSAREITLNGETPAFAVKENSDETGHNFGAIIFNVPGSEIRVMGHTDEATLEALARSILNRSAVRSASRHYSVRRLEKTFAAHGVHLRNVTPEGFRGLLAFLDGRPAHDVYVYVILEGCKCALNRPIPNAGITRHANVEVLWLRDERAAVRAALGALG